MAGQARRFKSVLGTVRLGRHGGSGQGLSRHGRARHGRQGMAIQDTVWLGVARQAWLGKVMDGENGQGVSRQGLAGLARRY